MTILQIAVTRPDVAPAWWEVLKGILLFLSTVGIGWMSRTLVQVRDDQRDMKHVVIGIDGTNGLRSKVNALCDDVDAIKERNNKIDAITEYERQQYKGEDRRAGPRRMRDVVHEAQDAKDHGRG